MKLKTGGEWIGGGKRVVRNNLTQVAFDMLGAFFAGPGGPRPAAIALSRSTGEVFVTRPCSFLFDPPDTGLGVVITGTATFSSSDVSEAAHFVALIDSFGGVLAEAELDPPLAAGSGLVITRRDFFVEAE